jgi:ABC-type dipeptide/oligopeptide/nickel transport system permease component
MIAERAPTTILLSVGSTLWALLVAIPSGVLSAINKDSWFDNIVRVVAMLGLSMPVHWLGLLLIVLFAVNLPIFPPGGTVSEFGPRAIVLPAIMLGFGLAALITRMTRSYMLEVLSQEYVNTARAKGLANWAVYYRHALQNALIPIITIVGFQFGAMLVGVIRLPHFARLMRGSILSLREQEFVVAARAIGQRDWRILFAHIVPNALTPLVVLMSLSIATPIVTESALSFLASAFVHRRQAGARS